MSFLKEVIDTSKAAAIMAGVYRGAGVPEGDIARALDEMYRDGRGPYGAATLRRTAQDLSTAGLPSQSEPVNARSNEVLSTLHRTAGVHPLDVGRASTAMRERGSRFRLGQTVTQLRRS